MENASKALLIAAAVLIVILLIGFGMRILNSAGDSSGQAEDLASSQQMQMFNAQFIPYIGSSRTGSTIRNLKVTVNKSNARNTKKVTLTTPQANVIDNGVYNVTATYDEDGYITAITVQ